MIRRAPHLLTNMIRLHKGTSAFVHRNPFAACSSTVPRPFCSSSPARSFATAGKIDGKGVSQEVWKEVAAEVEKLPRKPGLAVILVGDRPDSRSYVTLKHKAADACGFLNIANTLPEDVSQADLLRVVTQYNDDPNVDGILIQLPLPPHIDQKVVLRAIDRQKDVDGFHPYNLGGLARRGEELRQAKQKFQVNLSSNVPCTPLGCIELLNRYGVNPSGKHAVVLGRSNIVGLPMAMLLMHNDATVQICHSRTPNLPEACRQADILIAAIGRAEMVKGDWIKPGAVVIDVGVNFVDDASRKSGRRMCGDVDFKAAKEVASLITPVPGGVGPMTVAMLMRNTLSNAKRNVAEQNPVGFDRVHPVPEASWPPTSINVP
mmetsp:Transcript_13998/g.27146  ORF Transcript_13998/g.27146 Transcript_13998/m.27146 type:complete len:375 (+) Transcript_13998:30-1154(+)